MTKTFLAVAAFALLTSASLSGYAASPSQPAAAPASVAAAVLAGRGIGVSTREQNRGKLSLQ